MTAKSVRTHGSPTSRGGIVGMCIRAVLAGGAAAVLLLLLSAVICYSRPDPNAAAMPLAMASLYLSAAVCGLFAGRASEHPMLCGAAAGTAYCLLTLLLSLLSGGSGDGFSTGTRILLSAAIVAASAAGAFLSRRRTKRPSHPYKKRRR